MDEALISELQARKQYQAAVTATSEYEFITVQVENAYLPGEVPLIEDFDLVVSCVGPKNCYDLVKEFRDARAVISCENDQSTVKALQELSGNKNIFFGIPDVITSSTAPPDLLKQDPLMTVTERGVLVLQKGNYQLTPEILQVSDDKLQMHWMCKLFIHNAPHAIVAYLGWLKGYIYIHEAMEDIEIHEIVVGAMGEITDGVIASGYAGKTFATRYQKKELSRFCNKLLYDKIERVAREPLRKLAADNRLVLALRIAVFNGILPENTAKGLKAAMSYDNEIDEEAVYLSKLRETTSDNELLNKFSGIATFDPLNTYVANFQLSTSFTKLP